MTSDQYREHLIAAMMTVIKQSHSSIFARHDASNEKAMMATAIELVDTVVIPCLQAASNGPAR